MEGWTTETVMRWCVGRVADRHPNVNAFDYRVERSAGDDAGMFVASVSFADETGVTTRYEALAPYRMGAAMRLSAFLSKEQYS